MSEGYLFGNIPLQSPDEELHQCRLIRRLQPSGILLEFRCVVPHRTVTLLQGHNVGEGLFGPQPAAESIEQRGPQSGPILGQPTLLTSKVSLPPVMGGITQQCGSISHLLMRGTVHEQIIVCHDGYPRVSVFSGFPAEDRGLFRPPLYTQGTPLGVWKYGRRWEDGWLGWK